MAGLVPKTDFILPEGVVSLVTGGEPPLLKRHREAFERYARDKARGFAGYWDLWTVHEEVRTLLASMLDLQPGDIAMPGSASEGIAQVVSSVDWRDGDNAVTADLEYASGRFAFSGLRKLGVDARNVECPDRYVDIDRLLDACDERTRLVYVSQVEYLTGQLLDVERLSAELAARGIPLLNDVSHALGVTPVDGRLADFTVCCGYKWLLGTQTGIFAWNRQRRPVFEPRGIGWRSAASHEGEFVPWDDANRAQVGNSNHLDVYLLRESLHYLRAVGIDRIRAHVLRLGDTLLAALHELGVEIITPAAPGERAGNICFLHPDPAKLVSLAAADDILFWGDGGRIRVSIHLFNDEEDIERLIRFLEKNRAFLE